MSDRRRAANAAKAAKREHDRQLAVATMKQKLRNRLALLDDCLVKMASDHAMIRKALRKGEH
jgi:hypothetical protein